MKLDSDHSGYITKGERREEEQETTETRAERKEKEQETTETRVESKEKEQVETETRVEMANLCLSRRDARHHLLLPQLQRGQGEGGRDQ